MKKKYVKLSLLFLTLILTFNNVYAKECTAERKYVACGEGADKVSGIPERIPEITSFIVSFLQIIIPVVLIIMGMIEMVKAVVAGNPDNVAKSKGKLIKKFIAAIIAFFVVTLSTTAIELIAFNNEKSTFVSCMDCYLNNNCKRDCSYTSESGSDVLKYKECGDYFSNACPKSDDYGNICKSNGEECVVVGHNSCSDYPADKCVGDIYSSSNFKCELTASGCVQTTIRRTCGSYDPEKEGCDGKIDGSGRKCHLTYGGEKCGYQTCQYYSESECPTVDDTGINTCSVVNGKCTISGYTKCASYSENECLTNTKYDLDGNLCTYIYGSCRIPSDSCGAYDPTYCDKVIDKQGRKCKRITDDHGGNAQCVTVE